jgi:hypothetical protein
MTQPSLYSINAELADFEQVLADIYDNPDKPTTPEDEVALGEWLESINGKLVDKLAAVAKWRAHRLALVEARKVEIDKLRELNGRDGERIEAVKRLVLEVMQRIGHKKIETPVAVFSIAKEGGEKALIIDADAKLPDDCYETKTVVEVDKKRLRIYLEAGQEIAGARLKPKSETLRIK